MTIVYSPDAGQQTTTETLFYIQEFQGKKFTATLAREFAAKVERMDWNLTNQLEESIDTSTDMRAITKASLQLDDDTKELNLDLELGRSLCSGVERFITDILYTFGVE
jgi:hypothetical protein